MTNPIPPTFYVSVVKNEDEFTIRHGFSISADEIKDPRNQPNGPAKKEEQETESVYTTDSYEAVFYSFVRTMDTYDIIITWGEGTEQAIFRRADYGLKQEPDRNRGAQIRSGPSPHFRPE